METSKNIIIVDIDSTLHEYMHTVALVALNDFGIRVENPPDDWEGVFPDGIDRDVQIQIFNRCHDDDYIELTKPYPGSVEALDWMADEGYDIWYFTDRKKEAHAATVKWLMQHGFPNAEQVICSRDKRGQMNRWKESIFTVIDDRPRTMIYARYELGIPHVLSLKHEYNKNFTDIPGIHLHYHWDDIRHTFEKLITDVEERSGESE